MNCLNAPDIAPFRFHIHKDTHTVKVARPTRHETTRDQPNNSGIHQFLEAPQETSVLLMVRVPRFERFLLPPVRVTGSPLSDAHAPRV